MKTADSSPPEEISRVAVRFPPFWAKRPAVWFAQAEAQFTCENFRFCYVISQQDQRYATEVEDIITSPPEGGPYSTLRTVLVRRLSPSREQQIRQLLTLELGWMRMVSFTPQPLYPQGKSPWYPLDRRLGGPQSWSGRYGEMKILGTTGTQAPTPWSSSP
jgi:hypothetical protein